MWVWATPLAALQVADALGAQTGSFGQLLLRKSSGFPQPSQPRAKRGVVSFDLAGLPSFVMNLPTHPSRSKHSSRRRRPVARFALLPHFDCGSSAGVVWMVQGYTGAQTGGR